MCDERFLHRVQLLAVRHTFDREDVSAVVADRECEAGIDPASIDDDCAGTALAAVAALLCSLSNPNVREEGREAWTRGSSSSMVLLTPLMVSVVG
jgi:hypothetical protein